jgi:short subunit dehydrogenase-like uncharacterized protein
MGTCQEREGGPQRSLLGKGSMTPSFLIYGSYGYTGTLIVKQALEQGLEPVLAGRDVDRLKEQAKTFGLDYRVFDLDNPALIDANIIDLPAVLHCAGPFSRTYRAMAEACLRTQTHYLDITGEIEVFEALAAMDEEAKAARILLMPGVGFDVVPSDCLAAYLKKQLPSATHLTLAFKASGGLSRGTARTTLENLGRGGAIRQGGQITRVPTAYRTRTVAFDDKPTTTVTIPWGDVSTAYHSTGIPNIEVYLAVPRKLRRALIASRYAGWVLQLPPVQAYLRRLTDRQAPGPDDDTLRSSTTHLWGEVTDDAGQRVEARLQTPNGYALTASSAVHIMKCILQHHTRGMVGFQTPSCAFGPDLVLELDGVTRTDASGHTHGTKSKVLR